HDLAQRQRLHRGRIMAASARRGTRAEGEPPAWRRRARPTRPGPVHRLPTRVQGTRLGHARADRTRARSSADRLRAGPAADPQRPCAPARGTGRSAPAAPRAGRPHGDARERDDRRRGPHRAAHDGHEDLHGGPLNDNEPMSDSEPLAEADQPGMDHRRERIRIETERHRIEGVLTLARDGYRSRVSDVLNASERDFITLTDVTVAPLEGGPLELHAYLTVARRHIVFAVAAPESPEG